MKTSYLFKTLFAKFELFFSSFSKPSVRLIRDHLWDCPKVDSSKGGLNIGILLYFLMMISLFVWVSDFPAVTLPN